MKRLLVIITMLATNNIWSQLTTTNPDTVCFQTSVPSIYQVTSVGAGTYAWTVPTCATITSGQGTNSIQVNWASCPAGLITNAVTVTYTNAAGCVSAPVNLDVLIYQVVPTIAAIGPFCESDPCVTLTATPIGGTYSGTGVTGTQYCPTIPGSTITYTYTQSGCTFTATTNTTVTPVPVLTPIQHD